MKEAFLIISTFLPMISPLPYIRAILVGKVKPHRTTRLVYLLIGLLTTISLFVVQDRVAFWISLVSLGQAIVLFVLGLKFGVGGWTRSDIACLLLALTGVIAWQTTTDPIWGLYFGIVADFAGSLPTISKSWRDPGSEEPWFYLIDGMAGVFNTLAVENRTAAAVSYPVYLGAINFLIAFLVLRSGLRIE